MESSPSGPGSLAEGADLIAIISSTIQPSMTPSHDGDRTNLTPDLRLQQTMATVTQLLACGIDRIVLLDNSPIVQERRLRDAGFGGRFVHCPQPAFRNKGIGESWMLVSTPLDVADEEPVLKISGRYLLDRESPLLSPPCHGVKARIYGRGGNAQISTRAYTVSSMKLARILWKRSLDELYSLATLVRGPRSFWREFMRHLAPSRDMVAYSDPPISLEAATYRAARHLSIPLTPVPELGVTGVLGSWVNPVVSE